MRRAQAVIHNEITLGSPMEKDYLILKHASASRTSGEWKDDDYDVLANGEAVGRIFKANAAPVGAPGMWSLAFGLKTGRPHSAMPIAASRRWLR